MSPRIAPQLQVGHMPAAAPLSGITLTFALTPEQSAEIKALIQAQLTPGNPQYHQWLTPAEYAARFGLSNADLAKVEQWLQGQGFTIQRVANSRSSITFSGTVEQVETAFQTQMNQYRVDGKVHWSNATNLSIPAALQGVVLSVGNLNDFRPHPMVRPAIGNRVRPAFTSAQSGYNYMTPGDAAVIYDVNSAYQQGYDGTGVTIAVMGQTQVSASDIQNFDNAAGIPYRAPNMILVPDSGAATTYQGDESESDLDLEYSGAIAKGATIDFVYTGNSPNDDVFTALQYAVDNRIGSVISISYGSCETGMPSSQFTSLEQYTSQAAVQGQTIVASSGDSGSTSCYGYTNLTMTQQEALAANYPASSPNVLAVGGTEFQSADVLGPNSTGGNASQYWKSASGTDVTPVSALGYIPESTWNDDPFCGQYATKNNLPGSAICAGGGGVSAYGAMPSWQTGFPGISGTMRELPDVSLDSSNINAPYLYCTSDQSSWSPASGSTPAQAASCNSGFRDATSGDLTAAGGTSFAAPIVAGMMAIIDQKTSSSQGVAAAELYALAKSSSTSSSVFHDILSTSTSGGNQCTAGTAYCSSAGASQYAAAAGYDEATGLGSVDFTNLMNAWGSASSGVTPLGLTSITATPASSSVAAGSTDAITITVSPATATGTVTIYDGTTTQASAQIGTATLNAGTATFTYSPSSSTYNGVHTLSVVYGGGSGLAGAGTVVTVTVSGGTTPPAFTLSANPSTTTVTSGSSGTTTLTVASQNAYAGTVGWSLYVTSSNSSNLNNACFAITSSTDAKNGTVQVASGGTGTATLTFYTSASQCTPTSSTTSGGMRPSLRPILRAGAAGGQAHNRSPFGGAVPIGASAMAGLLLFGFRRSRSKLWTMLGCLMLAVALGGFATGCGGNTGSATTRVGTGTTTNNVPAGTYTFALVGADTSNGAINTQTNLTLTVN